MSLPRINSRAAADLAASNATLKRFVGGRQPAWMTGALPRPTSPVTTGDNRRGPSKVSAPASSQAAVGPPTPQSVRLATSPLSPSASLPMPHLETATETMLLSPIATEPCTLASVGKGGGQNSMVSNSEKEPLSVVTSAPDNQESNTATQGPDTEQTQSMTHLEPPAPSSVLDSQESITAAQGPQSKTHLESLAPSSAPAPQPSPSVSSSSLVRPPEVIGILDSPPPSHPLTIPARGCSNAPTSPVNVSSNNPIIDLTQEPTAECPPAKRRRTEAQVPAQPSPTLFSRMFALSDAIQLAPGSTAFKRRLLLSGACTQSDAFLLLLHQLYCLWFTRPRIVLDRLAIPSDELKNTFVILQEFFEDNARLPPPLMAIFSQKPYDLSGPSAVTALAETLGVVKLFLQRLHKYYRFLEQTVMNREYPYLVEELLLILGCSSKILQRLLFSECRRKLLGIRNGPLTRDFDQLFLRDQRCHLDEHGKFYVKFAEAATMNTRYAGLIKEYRAAYEAFKAAHGQTRVAASQLLGGNRPPVHTPVASMAQVVPRQISHPLPPNTNNSSHQLPIPPPGVAAQGSVPTTTSPPQLHPAFLAETAHLNHYFPSAPMPQYTQPPLNNASTHSLPVQFRPTPPMHVTAPPSILMHVSHQPPMLPTQWQPQPAPYRPVRPNITIPPQVNYHYQALQSHATRSYQTAPHRNSSASGLPIQPSASTITRKVQEVSLGSRADRTDGPWASARTPEWIPPPACDASPVTYYQVVKSLALDPRSIPPHEYVHKMQFEVNDVQMANLRKVGRPCEQFLPTEEHFEGALSFRLRCAQPRQPAAKIAKSQWLSMVHSWPTHIFISLNGQHLPIRRRVLHSPCVKDLPIHLNSYLRKGMNLLHIAVTKTEANSNSWHFVAVEMLETLTKSSMIEHIQTHCVMPSEQTLAKVKQRLATIIDEDDDGLAFSRTDLAIGLTDPFSARLFTIPVRGRDCVHLECFDLETWFDTRPFKHCSVCPHSASECECPSRENRLSEVDKWRCPICSEDARPHNLIIDQFLLSVRSQLEMENKLKAKSLNVSADGKWEAVVESDQSDDGNDDDDMTQHSAIKRHTKSPMSLSHPAQPEIICLDD